MVTAKTTKTTKKTTVKATPEAAADGAVKEKKPADPNMIKKKDVYEHVSVSTGLRKRDVREAVDSMLEYLNTCLTAGKTAQLPPLGKIKSVQRGTGEKMKMHYKLSLKTPDTGEKNDG